MPRYDYQCTACGRELEVAHRMSETIETAEHTDPATERACDGRLERLIPLVGVNQTLSTRGVSDTQLQRTGFTKYVRGSKGYEKAFGPPGSPDFVKRE